MATSQLDRLLLQSTTRDAMLQVLQTLESGGGIVTNKMKNADERDQLETALKEFGAVRSELGFWKKKTSNHMKREDNHDLDYAAKRPRPTTSAEELDQSLQPSLLHAPSIMTKSIPSRPVYGAPLPSSAATIVQQPTVEDLEEDEGPLPATAPSRRLPQISREEGDAKTSLSGPTSSRGEWMMQELKETDPTSQLRNKAMTSQTARTFANYKTAPGSDRFAIGQADSRAVATGKASVADLNAASSTTTTTSHPKDFRWNHEEMMAVEKIDKSRLNKMLTETIDSRFTPSSSSKRFL